MHTSMEKSVTVNNLSCINHWHWSLNVHNMYEVIEVQSKLARLVMWNGNTELIY